MHDQREDQPPGIDPVTAEARDGVRHSVGNLVTQVGANRRAHQGADGEWLCE